MEGIRKPEAAPLARVTSDDALLNMLVKEKRKKKEKRKEKGSFEDLLRVKTREGRGVTARWWF